MKFLLPLILISLVAYDIIMAQGKGKIPSLKEEMQSKSDTSTFLNKNKKLPRFRPFPYSLDNMPFMKPNPDIDYKIKIFTPPDSIDYKMNYFRIFPERKNKKDIFILPPGRKQGIDSVFKMPRLKLK